MLWLNLLFFIASCVVLVVSGTFLVKSLTKIAQFLHFSEYVIAFILMAFATSIPELFVGISSALAKNTELILGTVIGSNIADIVLIGGITILLARGIKIKSKKIKRDSLFMIPIALLPLILFFIGNSISRIDGAILLAVFFLYSWHLIRRRKKFKRELEKDRIKRTEIVTYSILFIVFLALLFFSAHFVVRYASALAIDLALPAILIGLFLIALGTSLPELAFESRAALMGHSEMALGDLMGSVVANSTLVLGIAALIYPLIITTYFMLFLISAIFMMVFIFLFSTFIHSGSKLYIMEGIALLLLYIVFIFIELFSKGMFMP